MLDKHITCGADAIRYLTYLHENDLLYHMDDDAFEVEFQNTYLSKKLRGMLNMRRDEMFEVIGEEWTHSICLVLSDSI